MGGEDLAERFCGRVLRQWLYVDDGCGWVVGRLWGVGARLGFWRAEFFFFFFLWVDLCDGLGVEDRLGMC